jgi:hypothetical protein
MTLMRASAITAPFTGLAESLYGSFHPRYDIMTEEGPAKRDARGVGDAFAEAVRNNRNFSSDCLEVKSDPLGPIVTIKKVEGSKVATKASLLGRDMSKAVAQRLRVELSSNDGKAKVWFRSSYLGDYGVRGRNEVEKDAGIELLHEAAMLSDSVKRPGKTMIGEDRYGDNPVYDRIRSMMNMIHYKRFPVERPFVRTEAKKERTEEKQGFIQNHKKALIGGTVAISAALAIGGSVVVPSIYNHKPTFDPSLTARMISQGMANIKPNYIFSNVNPAIYSAIALTKMKDGLKMENPGKKKVYIIGGICVAAAALATLGFLLYDFDNDGANTFDEVFRYGTDPFKFNPAVKLATECGIHDPSIVKSVLPLEKGGLENNNQLRFLGSIPLADRASILKSGNATNFDLDKDNMSNYYELVAGLPWNVYNGRYAILVETNPNLMSRVNKMYDFLTNEEKFLNQNVTKLSSTQATIDYFKNACSDVQKKATKNDIVFISLDGDGNNGVFAFNDGKGDYNSGHCPKMTYVDINKCIDFKSRDTIVCTYACADNTALGPLMNGASSRAVINMSADWIFSASPKYTNGVWGKQFSPIPLSDYDINGDGFVSLRDSYDTMIKSLNKLHPELAIGYGIADPDRITDRLSLGDFQLGN